MQIDQEKFNRIANATFSGILGAIVGGICLILDMPSWSAVLLTAIWTAHGCYTMYKP